MAKLLSGHCSSRRWAWWAASRTSPTDQVQGIAPVPLWVRPEPRRPGWDYRSPIIADGLQPLISRVSKCATIAGCQQSSCCSPTDIAASHTASRQEMQTSPFVVTVPNDSCHGNISTRQPQFQSTLDVLGRQVGDNAEMI